MQQPIHTLLTRTESASMSTAIGVSLMKTRSSSPESVIFLLAYEERAKLVFPDDWDISEAKRLSGAKQPGRPDYTDTDKNRFYGDI